MTRIKHPNIGDLDNADGYIDYWDFGEIPLLDIFIYLNFILNKRGKEWC